MFVSYLMNVVSSEFPLRTHDQLMMILSIYNGSNDVDIHRNFKYLEERIYFSWKEDREKNEMKETGKRKLSPPPYEEIAKGFTNAVLYRDFVKYALFDLRARVFLKWLEDTWAPDEM